VLAFWKTFKQANQLHFVACAEQFLRIIKNEQFQFSDIEPILYVQLIEALRIRYDDFGPIKNVIALLEDIPSVMGKVNG
jgi:hypothetical protein